MSDSKPSRNAGQFVGKATVGELTKGQLLRFAATGGMSGGVYLVILFALQPGLRIMVASALAYTAAMAVNYLCQRIWTFRSGRVHHQAVPRYVAVHLAGILINGATLHLAAEVYGLPLLPVQGAALVLVAGWGFTLQKVWVFTSPPTSDTESIHARQQPRDRAPAREMPYD